MMRSDRHGSAFLGSGFCFRAARAESQLDTGPGSCANWKRLGSVWISAETSGGSEERRGSCLLQGNAWNDACSQVMGRGAHLFWVIGGNTTVSVTFQTCQAAMRASHLSTASCSAVGACQGVGGVIHGAQDALQTWQEKT